MNSGFKAPSPAMVVSVTALFVALGGTGYASTAVAGHASTTGAPRHSNAQKKSKPNDNRQDTALIKKLAPRLRVAFAKNAGTATNASHAASAANATNATTATNATNATTATNADLLGGLPGSLYQRRNAEGSALAGALITSAG